MFPDENMQLALTCNLYREKQNQEPVCVGVTYMFCLETGQCKFRNEFFSQDKPLDPPCHPNGEDCPTREVGCKSTCLVWRRYEAEKLRRKAAEKPNVVGEYLSSKIKTKHFGQT